MKIAKIITLISLIASLFVACDDDISSIGQDIVNGQMVIHIDSTYYNLNGKSIKAYDTDARTDTTLLGSISTPHFGNLNCSFVTQLLPATSISIPDSIPLSDVVATKMLLRIPRNKITGDSLAPQQLTVYPLTSSLPGNIQANWNPQGKYDPNFIAKTNYSLSAISMGDSAFKKLATITIPLDLNPEYGRQAVAQYRKNAEIFQWPATFAEKYPGIFVKSTFGKGCIANVSNLSIYAYYNHKRLQLVTENNNSEYKYVTVTDSVCLFSTAPEVISSSLISYHPSSNIDSMVGKGDVLITTPGGYIASFDFPAQKVLEDFWKKSIDLTVINNLLFSIPSSTISNDLNIGVPPGLLMVKKSEAENFFIEGKMPDNKTSFIASYNKEKGGYIFPSMRSFIVELSKKKDQITEEDTAFVLIPVSSTTETFTSPVDGSTISEVTSCLPYITKPTTVKLHTDKALIIFTYSNQVIN